MALDAAYIPCWQTAGGSYVTITLTVETLPRMSCASYATAVRLSLFQMIPVPNCRVRWQWRRKFDHLRVAFAGGNMQPSDLGNLCILP